MARLWDQDALGARRQRSRSPWATLRATPPGVWVTAPGTDPPRCSVAPASGRACDTGHSLSDHRSGSCGSGTRRCCHDHQQCRAWPPPPTSRHEQRREAGACSVLSRCDRHGRCSNLRHIMTQRAVCCISLECTSLLMGDAHVRQQQQGGGSTGSNVAEAGTARVGGEP